MTCPPKNRAQARRNRQQREIPLLYQDFHDIEPLVADRHIDHWAGKKLIHLLQLRRDLRPVLRQLVGNVVYVQARRRAARPAPQRTP